MIIYKFLKYLVFIFLPLFIFSCTTEQVIFHGEIGGLVSDASTTLPLQAATVKIANSGDSTITGSDGSWLLKNLTPGEYILQAFKSGYGDINKNIKVEEAKTGTINLSMFQFPVPYPSDTLLYFGFDSTSLHFTISNTGKGSFNYALTPNQSFINLNPSTGTLNEDEIDTIIVTVNRTGLAGNTEKAKIKLSSIISEGQIPDIYIDVYLNNIFDNRDNKHKYYNVVKIGTQTWMAENLNVGTRIDASMNQTNNGSGNIEKYCYSDIEGYCNTYGGLYMWPEMMNYNPADDHTTGITQGICPDGWHLPTKYEWRLLNDYIGGDGGSLKETGSTHWALPNTGATDEYGFSGLPGGSRSIDFVYRYGSEQAAFWSTTLDTPNNSLIYVLNKDNAILQETAALWNWGLSVRCIKDIAKSK